jgi:hypothetical protein
MGIFDFGSIGSGIGGVLGDVIGGPVKGLAGGITTQVGDVPDYVKAQQIGALNSGPQDQARAQQMQFAQALQAQAAGQGPSPTQALLNNALAQQTANANALAASQRGVNPALAMRQAMQSNANAAQQSAAQGVVGRQQEQLNAQSQLGAALQGMRGQDLSGMGLDLQRQAANQHTALGASGINAGIATGNAQMQNQVVGGLMNAGGAAAMAMSSGGVVPGHAAYGGDSYGNDTVPTMLSPGEIVIPRTSASDPGRAKEFIDHLLKEKESKEGPSGYAKVLAAHRRMKGK